MKRYLPKIAFLAAAGLVISALAVAALISGAYLYMQPSLPTVEAMRQIELQVPLRVYSRDGQVIAQIGEQRRIPVTFDDVPPLVRQAFIAAEDDRFFEHSGFDYRASCAPSPSTCYQARDCKAQAPSRSKRLEIFS